MESVLHTTSDRWWLRRPPAGVCFPLLGRKSPRSSLIESAVVRLQLMEQQVDSDDDDTTIRPVVLWHQLLPPDNHLLFHRHSSRTFLFRALLLCKTDIKFCCGVLVSPLSLAVVRANNSKLCYFLLNTKAGGRMHQPGGKITLRLKSGKALSYDWPSIALLVPSSPPFLSAIHSLCGKHQLPFYPPFL